MPGLDGLPAEWQLGATIVFVAAVSLFAAWSRVFGKKEGPAAPKVQEFYASGQIADMGPVKELTAQLTKVATGQAELVAILQRLAEQHEAEVADQRIEDEVERRVQTRKREEASRRRRTSSARRPQKAEKKIP